ncbi:nucleotide sugar dehydrogenase [Bythopirellula polymerisocia]|uniref:UDP-N-acetyl-D-glucosamine 6-dehydrogenase n=1 Tax=Bythopirellula polymerisocia TaxID=2528003 RepID=A0A5C6CQ94_9BACT|nr:nucleotide sugar dehydrogenase [Bythopirellula polymerisocia]TWU25787.1 UDP-N-acetyl-D-glucosamine 6-dehydrogenase [Bythopirellula polymerisocia]
MSNGQNLKSPQLAKKSLAESKRADALDPLACTAIVGLGYVGLPLCLQFAKSGYRVLGLDIDAKKVDAIQAGNSYIGHIPAADIADCVDSERLSASTDFERIREASAVIICVPTPLSKNFEPDISYILATGTAIAPHLQPGTLVVLESTTYPGTTDTELREVLEAGSGMVAGVDFHLAFSPEREDPGNPASKVATIPKVVGGFTPECLAKAVELYSSAVDEVVPVNSCRVAEATKLLENIYRSVNIALVNELKVIYGAMDIDIWEVIAAAKTKPFGFNAFYPGPGLGGHCIPIDPFYLSWKAREYGHRTRFIELAGEINRNMPRHVIEVLGQALNQHHKSIRRSRILVVGLAYKPNVGDERESPSFVFLEELTKRGAEVEYYDPYVPEIRPTREHPQWAGKQSIAWSEENLASFDLVLISTNHACIDYQQLADWAPLIVDTRNAMFGVETKADQVWKA